MKQPMLRVIRNVSVDRVLAKRATWLAAGNAIHRRWLGSKEELRALLRQDQFPIAGYAQDVILACMANGDLPMRTDEVAHVHVIAGGLSLLRMGLPLERTRRPVAILHNSHLHHAFCLNDNSSYSNCKARGQKNCSLLPRAANRST
jgi:hypothetical protein